MKTCQSVPALQGEEQKERHAPMNRILRMTAAIALCGAVAGCGTTGATEAGDNQASKLAGSPEGQKSAFTLQAGDIVKITFPGAPDLNPAEPLQIRRDGKITLPIVGEVAAAGLTPAELQSELIGLYSKQLQSKEVVVAVVSSSFSVFVDGAVLHSGKITVNHPLTILEAIMEAGGFDYNKANTESVTVIRKQPATDTYAHYTVNLKLVLKGEAKEVFYLAPGDMVHVPERFSWF